MRLEAKGLAKATNINAAAWTPDHVYRKAKQLLEKNCSDRRHDGRYVFDELMIVCAEGGVIGKQLQQLLELGIKKFRKTIFTQPHIRNLTSQIREEISKHGEGRLTWECYEHVLKELKRKGENHELYMKISDTSELRAPAPTEEQKEKKAEKMEKAKERSHMTNLAAIQDDSTLEPPKKDKQTLMDKLQKAEQECIDLQEAVNRKDDDNSSSEEEPSYFSQSDSDSCSVKETSYFSQSDSDSCSEKETSYVSQSDSESCSEKETSYFSQSDSDSCSEEETSYFSQSDSDSH
jgi:hypothetical protein